MPTDEPQDTESKSDPVGNYSDSKNVFGVEMNKAKPIGNLLVVISVPLTVLFSLDVIFNPSVGGFVLAGAGMFIVPLSLYFRVSEEKAMAFNENMDQATNEIQDTDDDGPVTTICRECHEEVSSTVTRCPNCGWKPKKKGGLWWGATAAMSLNPVGWAMGAKGASDKVKASKGVTKEVSATESEDSPGEVEPNPEADPTDTLERLNDLKKQGAITEAEFEEKKKELLDRI